MLPVSGVQAAFTELTDQLQRIETAANRQMVALSETLAAANRHLTDLSVKATARSDRPMIGETADKRAFVRRCLTGNPTMKVADIQRQARRRSRRTQAQKAVRC